MCFSIDKKETLCGEPLPYDIPGCEACARTLDRLNYILLACKKAAPDLHWAIFSNIMIKGAKEEPTGMDEVFVVTEIFVRVPDESICCYIDNELAMVPLELAAGIYNKFYSA